MPPTDCAANGTPARRAAAARPSVSDAVVAASLSWNPGASTSRSVARPAATATGLPESVPA